MTILVLGAGGMAGSMITKYLSLEFGNVTPWYRQDYSAPNTIPDLSKFDYVINCIGIIKQKTVPLGMMEAINARFPVELSKHCNRLFHISSDCVFSGKISEDQAYRTDDFKDAEDDYGKSKSEGENIQAMVLRTSIIGPSKDHAGLFEWFINTDDSPVKGFDNHWWSGVTTLQLAKTISRIIKNNNYHNGIWQVASEKVSKLELLHLINSIWRLDKEIVPYHATESINRVLIPDIGAKNLTLQLHELKEFMK